MQNLSISEILAKVGFDTAENKPLKVRGSSILQTLEIRTYLGRGTYVKIKSLGGVNMVKLNKL